MPVTYIKGADLPDLAVEWQDNDGDVIDFSTGWTFTVLVGSAGQAALITKTTGFIGAATSPNLVVIWDEGELDILNAGQTYTVAITATRVSDNRERKLNVRIYMENTVAPAVD